MVGISASGPGGPDKLEATSSERYELLTRLAVGGMAEIHLARMRGIGGFERHVVVKQLLPQFMSDDEFVRMFLDEARLAAQLQHQNIGQVSDIGALDGRYFFAMEYLHGHDARDLLAVACHRGERIPLEHSLTIATNVAAGLHYAHSKCGDDGQPLNVVHRDVSPANILITYEGGVKLVDFGIARAATRTNRTRTGTIRGKISYMSPEQCLGSVVDSRSDIFSLGVVLWELCTTSRLFRADSADSDYLIMDRIVKGEVPRPSTVVSDVPAELEAIIMNALSRRPEDRYSPAQEFLLAIEEFARKERMRLSTAALSRYLIDVFGRRPEPWHAIERKRAASARGAPPVEASASTIAPGGAPAVAQGDVAVVPAGDVAPQDLGDVAPQDRDDVASQDRDDVASQDRDDVASQDRDDVAPQDRGDVAPQDLGDVAPQDLGDVAPQDLEDEIFDDATIVSEPSFGVEPDEDPSAVPLHPGGDAAPAPVTGERISRRIELPLPAEGAPTIATAPLRRTSPEMTVPAPPPPLDDDSVSIEMVLPSRAGIWWAVVTLVVIAGLLAVAVAL